MLVDDLHASLSIAVANLLSIPVLAFALGVLASRVGGDLRLPDAAYRLVSTILLLAIGIKGGVALRGSSAGEIAGPIAATVLLGVVIPVAAFWALRLLTPLGRMDRGAMAAHYGSTSLVTFTAALVLLEATGVAAEGYLPTLLAVMEVPGIVLGLALAGPAVRATGQTATGHAGGLSAGIREVLTSTSVLLLAGGLVMGAASGAEGYRRVEPLFGGLFQGLLVLFLLHLGSQVGRQLAAVRAAGPGLIAFALCFPLVAGSTGVALGTLVGLGPGGATLLGVLCGSASYIAAPAAVRIALPEANETVCLTSSLAITFPFNLVLGIPLLAALAAWAGALG